MSDSYSSPQQNSRGNEDSRYNGRNGSRNERSPGNRDQGGFRIRLSDNEMRAARALQEALNLRSTVAVLGFSLRTLGQMLEEGKLDELIAQQKSQGSRGGGRREDGGGGYGSKRNRFNDESKGSSNKGTKPNPFARPQKPQTSKPEKDQTIPTNSSGDPEETIPEEHKNDSSPDVINQPSAEENLPAENNEESPTSSSHES